MRTILSLSLVYLFLAVVPHSSAQSLTEEFADDLDADYTLDCENLGSFSISVGFPGGIEQCNLYKVTPGLAILAAGGENELHFYSTNGSYWFDWDIDPDNNYPYGVACATSHVYVNDESGNNDRGANMYRSPYNTNWEETNNPVGDDGRGMSFDYVTDRIFEANDPYKVTHFQPGSSSGYYFDMSSYVSGDFIAGVATCDADEVFPDIGISGTAVVVCMRGNDNLWLFIRRTSGTWTFVDSCDMPSISQEYNQGITYQEETGYFYLANHSSGTTRIYKLDLSIEVPSNPPDINRVNPASSSVSIESGESINFQVSATDVDGDLNFFEWYLDGSFMVNHSASGSSDSDAWSNTFNSPGNYHVDAFIYDDELNADSTYWNITVDNDDPPTISRVSPIQQNIVITQGTTVEFVVEANDPEGALNFFEWYIDTEFQCNHPSTGSTDQDSWEYKFNYVDTLTISCYVYDEGLNEAFTYWNVIIEPLVIIQEFFDDFNYSTTDDMSNSECDWWFPEGVGGPGPGSWSTNMISFLVDPSDANDKLVVLSGVNEGDTPGILKAGFRSNFMCMNGTYAARVYFNDFPEYGPNGDAVVETFYLSSEYSTGNPDFCEYDYEYLPNTWIPGGSSPRLDLVAWDQVSPDVKDTLFIHESYSDWHTLLFQIDNSSIQYWIDGDSTWSTGGTFLPESDMAIWFNIWFAGLINDTGSRSFCHMVDWVYHCKDEYLPIELIEGIVQYYSDTDVQRKNTMNFVDVNDRACQSIPMPVFHGITPNPVRSIGAISYELPHESYVEIYLYDLYGRKIQTIWCGNSAEGLSVIQWIVSSIPSGVYFVKLNSDELMVSERVLILD